MLGLVFPSNPPAPEIHENEALDVRAVGWHFLSNFNVAIAVVAIELNKNDSVLPVNEIEC